MKAVLPMKFMSLGCTIVTSIEPIAYLGPAHHLISCHMLSYIMLRVATLDAHRLP